MPGEHWAGIAQFHLQHRCTLVNKMLNTQSGRKATPDSVIQYPTTVPTLLAWPSQDYIVRVLFTAFVLVSNGSASRCTLHMGSSQARTQRGKPGMFPLRHFQYLLGTAAIMISFCAPRKYLVVTLGLVPSAVPSPRGGFSGLSTPK